MTGSDSDRLKDDSLINIAAAELQRSYIGEPLPNQYKSKQETTKGPALGRLELALFDKDSDDRWATNEFVASDYIRKT